MELQIPKVPKQHARLSPALKHITEAIESSRAILDLEKDWDGEASPPFSPLVWQRAVDFLAIQSTWALRQLNISLDAPRILPSGGGSIDLHWKTDSYELLVNIPAEQGKSVQYYGDNRCENMPIRGSCEVGKPDRKLISWLSLFK